LLHKVVMPSQITGGNLMSWPAQCLIKQQVVFLLLIGT
jgi:hypothetical protein